MKTDLQKAKNALVMVIMAFIFWMVGVALLVAWAGWRVALAVVLIDFSRDLERKADK